MNKDFEKRSERISFYIMRARNGGDINQCFEDTINAAIPITNYILSQVKYPPSIQTDDLIQEAYIVLYKCFMNYDIRNSKYFYRYYGKAAFKAIYNYIYKFQTSFSMHKEDRIRLKNIREFSKAFYEINNAYPERQDYIDVGFKENEINKFMKATAIYNYETKKNENENDLYNIPSDTKINIDDKILLDEILEEIKEKDSTVYRTIIMRYYEGKTYDEIARLTKTPKTTIIRKEKNMMETIRKEINE